MDDILILVASLLPEGVAGRSMIWGWAARGDSLLAREGEIVQIAHSVLKFCTQLAYYLS